MEKRRVILVTDGDKVAKEAVEIAASNIGGRCISASAGNPTVLTGKQIIELIEQAEYDPVVVMVDDRGARGIGKGEKVMDAILYDENIDVLGVIAVSSNGKDCRKINLSCSITSDGRVIEGVVDKDGIEKKNGLICGDTLSVLKNKKSLIIVGIGDPGKMGYYDDCYIGAPITTMAMKEILIRSNFSY